MSGYNSAYYIILYYTIFSLDLDFVRWIASCMPNPLISPMKHDCTMPWFSINLVVLLIVCSSRGTLLLLFGATYYCLINMQQECVTTYTGVYPYYTWLYTFVAIVIHQFLLHACAMGKANVSDNFIVVIHTKILKSKWVATAIMVSKNWQVAIWEHNIKNWWLQQIDRMVTLPPCACSLGNNNSHHAIFSVSYNDVSHKLPCSLLQQLIRSRGSKQLSTSNQS